MTLTHAFEIQSTEVTQGQFQQVMGYNPSSFASCGTSCPVENITWHEAVAYCNALSTKRGLTTCYSCSGSGINITCSEAAAYSGAGIYVCPGYRLPTEAESEYAYRAGSGEAYYIGTNDRNVCMTCSTADANLDLIAWYCGNSGMMTHPVGTSPCSMASTDMAGNVWEWCHDWWQDDLGAGAITDPFGPSSGSYRVLRGGSWTNFSRYLRASMRYCCFAPDVRTNEVGARCVRTL